LWVWFEKGAVMNDRLADPEYRSPEQVRQQGNQLSGMKSRHLRQHSKGPVDWYSWSDKAFTRAKATEKPIFLSIGYASNHLTSLMAFQVFEDDEVAELLNRHFVCIKVDREELPAVDSVYLRAVQLLNNHGGWPLSVFLTSDGKPFFGGTAFARTTFLEMLGKIMTVYRENRDELELESNRICERITSLPEMPPETERATRVDEDMVDAAAKQIRINFDKKWGGFAGKEKFLVPYRWRFLLKHYQRVGLGMYRSLTEVTLEAMMSGGIYDHVGGGFFHLATDRKWLIPNYEKLLADNAQMASLYFEAGTVCGRPDFHQIGCEVLDFLLDEMLAEGGAFQASLAAGTRDGEGTYYQWTIDDLTIATNADDGPVLAEVLDVGLPGNVEGTDRCMLTRRVDLKPIAEELDLNIATVSGLFEKHRNNLLAYRRKRFAPAGDRKIITAWNGLAISALVQGASATGSDRYRQAAITVADYLWAEHRNQDGSLIRCATKGQSDGVAVLRDYAFLACGLLDLFELTRDSQHLARALKLIEFTDENFAAEDGGYYLTAKGASSTEAPLGRIVDYFDVSTPSGNSAMLYALAKAGKLADRPEYLNHAQKTLDQFAPLLAFTQLETAGWFMAAEMMM